MTGTTAKSIEAKKGKSISDLLRSYSPQTPEETRKTTRIHTPIIEQTLRIFEPCLEADFDLDEVCAIAEGEAGTLTPDEIDLFLQASIKYDDDRWYAGAMGIFISVLMKKSCEAGYQNFTLNLRNFTSRLDHLWSELEYPGIYLTVNGNPGDYLGSFARNSYLQVNGDVNDYPGGHAKDCTFVFEGDVGDFFAVKFPRNNTYIFHGEVGKVGNITGDHITFKTSNERTLYKLIDKLETLSGNRIYFINPDKTEVLVKDYDGKS